MEFRDKLSKRLLRVIDEEKHERLIYNPFRIKQPQQQPRDN
jgi:hypothetical protein